MPKLTDLQDLQELNGLDMGRILQTNVSCIGVRTGAAEGSCATSATFFGPINWSMGRSGKFII